MRLRNVVIQFCLLAVAVGMLVSCSTKKNTPLTRFYHSMTAHYNIMYNGEVAFGKGMDAQTDGHKDDYTSLLPMYISTNKTTADMGRANYALAIEKCEKAIKLHSIKKKPAAKTGRKRTQAQKDYLARREFNPYLWRSWQMMGESQFNKGEFIEAASTFNYMTRLYATQPEIAGMARSWLARCYVALDWPYDAEDVLRKMSRDSMTTRVRRSYDNSRTAWLIQTGQYEEAIPLLRKTISRQRGTTARARLNYLLAQLCRETGQRKEAYAALKKVIRSNPPYEMTLNARILQAEMAGQTQTRKMVRKLQRMAKNDNNKNYVDQIYMAIGNIYLNGGDSTRCTQWWEKGLLESKGGAAKGTLLLRLADLYWEQEEYGDAARCYKECATVLAQEHEDRPRVDSRNSMLEGLAEPLGVIELQDSLQALAKLPAAELDAACQRLAKEYTRKEKEEAKRREAQGEAANKQAGMNGTANGGMNPALPDAGAASDGGSRGWYFSNPRTVAQGRNAFFRKWGKRRNADLWRWADRTGFADVVELPEGLGEQEPSEWDSAADSLDIDEDEAADTLENDPHNKEYYMKQVPLTEEQMEASHALLSDALFKAGVLEQGQLGNYPLAHRTLLRFISDYPGHEKVGEACYHLMLICGRLDMDAESDYYRQRVISDFPDSRQATLLANPRYDLIARGGKHLEDSLYADAYTAYRRSEYEHVKEGYAFASENFPEGRHRARFMFVHAMSLLYSGDRDGFLASLRELIEKYSEEEVTKLASEIMKGVSEGRLLREGQWDTSAMWAMRSLAGADSTAAGDTLSRDRLGAFDFVLAYPKGALDEDQLLFEVARYNFTAFTLRNFELELSDLGDISMLTVKGFRSYDEVHAYAQRLYGDRHMAAVLEGLRSLMILDDNLRLLGTKYSFDDYARFHDTYLTPMDIPEELRLDNTKTFRGEDEVPSEREPQDETVTEDDTEEYEDEDDFPFGF